MARVVFDTVLKHFQKFEIVGNPIIIWMEKFLTYHPGVSYETENAKIRSTHEV